VTIADRNLFRASVIVPVYNCASTLGTCLGALLAQTVDAREYEVIVVDDGSTDGSAIVAAQYAVTVEHQDHAGAAGARNLGAQRARSAILLFTDADCEPLPDWIEQMLGPFVEANVVGVKGVYQTRQGSPVARFVQAEHEEKYNRLARTDRIDFVDTYAAAYRRELFLAHGGFDPEFLLVEDQEFSYRLARAGRRLVFAPGAAVYHQHPSTIWDYTWRKAQIGRWKVRVHIRHPGKAVRDSYTPWTQKAQIVLLPLACVAGIAAILALVPASLAAILALLGLVTAVPLTSRASSQGWQVAMIAPGLVFLRALALGVGLMWGGLHLLGSKLANMAKSNRSQEEKQL
jgi:cellulose synthase/poly-beta-1,6-N-acetylglucosamine synthase-like glycosyltransferase